MKKVISYFLVVTLVFIMLFAFSGNAFAADVAWSASFSPSEMTSGGTVTFSTSVTNNSSNPVTNVTLYYPDGTAINLTSSLAAGDSISRVDENFSISTDQLGEKQEFKLVYTTSDNVQHTLTGTATVSKKAGTVKVTGSASANKSTIENSGDRVTITFNFKNTGDVTVTNCRLYASPINGGDELTQNTFSLEPGESKTLTYTTAVTSDMSITPKLTYNANGSSGSVSTNTVNVKLAEQEEEEEEESTGSASLKVAAVSDLTEVEAGGTVEFTISVTNNGDQDISSLKLTDDFGNNISLNSTSLAAGAIASGKVTYTVDEATSYKFSATAKDENGESVKASSSPITINISDAADDTPKGLYIDVVAENYELQEPGEAAFNITITNTSI